MDLALSIKQPWASLVVHGIKTIEVRRWSTRQRGRVLIHAGRISDNRPEADSHVPLGLKASTGQRGGIVGEANVVECRCYTSAEAFARDRGLHFNEPSWFQGPAMYGFVLESARPLAFRRCPGSLYFFEVGSYPSAPAICKTGLLVSVRNAEEAAAALEGGAELIDVKEPLKGALGRPTNDTIKEVVDKVAGRRPVSAALGELVELRSIPAVSGMAFVKCGLAKLGGSRDWQRELLAFRARLGRRPQAPEVVTVAYADWRNAGAPPWHEVAQFALRDSGGVLLLDTFDKRRQAPGKGNRQSTLLDWLSFDEINRLCRHCQAAGVRIALGGSLKPRHIIQLLDAKPTWIAVRGAVCEANERDGAVHILKVRDLVELIRWHQREETAES